MFTFGPSQIRSLVIKSYGKALPVSSMKKKLAAVPLRFLFLASTAAVCRSRLSSHALNAECPIVIRRLEDHLVRPV
jgi:hypothetical protein